MSIVRSGRIVHGALRAANGATRLTGVSAVGIPKVSGPVVATSTASQHEATTYPDTQEQRIMEHMENRR